MKISAIGTVLLAALAVSWNGCSSPEDPEDYSLNDPYGDLDGDGLFNGEDVCPSDPGNACNLNLAVFSRDQLMEKMKQKSCMFNGLLSGGIPDLNEQISTLKRSNCESLPRAIETWTKPPDFALAGQRIQSITSGGSRFEFGMFIAEAISTTAQYPKYSTGGRFNFAAMCKAFTNGKWGSNTCVPTTGSAEFRDYIQQITTEAIRLGISDFLFGQLDYLDNQRLLPQMINTMRTVAAEQGKNIVVGGQVNAYRSADDAYIKAFDYVIAPSRMAKNGNFYAGADCRKWSELPSGFCDVFWAPPVAAVARTVIVEFDWFSNDDDIHRFARLNAEGRQRTLVNARNVFIRDRGLGFIMPFMGPLNAGIQDGCFGESQWVYSASKNYSCNVEDDSNLLLAGTPVQYLNQTISEQVIDLYVQILNRNPLPGDRRGYEYWYAEISSGARTCSDAVLAITLTDEAVRLGSTNPANYYSICGSSGNGTDHLYPNQVLNPGEQLNSNDGRYSLKMQTDFNLVLYNNGTGRAEWATGTNNKGAASLVFQLDRNLVVQRKSDGKALWAAGTANSNGSRLVLQNDGNLVLYRSDRSAAWDVR